MYKIRAQISMCCFDQVMFAMLIYLMCEKNLQDIDSIHENIIQIIQLFNNLKIIISNYL